jgi:small ligand-binding sensory domain FIST
MVLEIAGEPALDALTRAGMGLSGQPLVLGVLARDGSGEGDAGTELLVRGVQGVDPSVRGLRVRGLLVSDEAREGVWIAFAVRDGRAAQAEIERLARELSRDIAGALPLCGLYVNCSARGQHLYGRPNVDTRVLRERFGDIPIAGVQSAFEIAPHGDVQSLQLYCGVFSLFTALS